MDDAVLLSLREGSVLELCMNRPHSKNSLNAELVSALVEAFTTAGADDGVRVIVLTGAGGAFCSGVDLRSAAADMLSEERLEARLTGFHALIRVITSAHQPVLAAIDGPAVGFGADLALACDLRIATARAYFEEKFIALGLMPDGGGTFHLPRLIGVGRALEHLLLGTRIDAEAAFGLGLVNRVTSVETLLSETQALAARLANSPPLALRAIKHAVRDGLASALDAALERERRGQLELLKSEDVREGVSAFLERRAPVFRGR